MNSFNGSPMAIVPSTDLKVVHLCTNDSAGGAAIAARRLMMAQRACGIHADMLVLKSTSGVPHVSPLWEESPWVKGLALGKKVLEAGSSWICQGFRRARIFETSIPITGFSLRHHPLIHSSDVIHLHWINQGFLGIRSLREIAQLDKRIVFTLHDVWPVTAVCHYLDDCTKFCEKKGCYDCPQLQPGIPFLDIAHLVFEQKKRLYQAMKPSFVGCSRWITSEAKRSSLSGSYPIDTIPNVFDKDSFYPTPRVQARLQLGLPTDRPILLFGAARLDNPRKGFQEMIAALQHFYATPYAQEMRPLAVLFGKIEQPDQLAPLRSIDLKCVGYISSPQEMALYYSAANVFVTPSLTDNLPNTIIEAAATGCPTVAFQVGGIPEMIIHGTTGYLARYRDIEDLSRGITEMLQATEEGPIDLCRTETFRRYDTTTIVKQYNDVYQRRNYTDDN